nr:hypothetical protein [uncultured bacterium]
MAPGTKAFDVRMRSRGRLGEGELGEEAGSYMGRVRYVAARVGCSHVFTAVFHTPIS